MKIEVPHYFEFFHEIVTENQHCVMVGLPKFEELMKFIDSIPDDIVFRPDRSDYGKTTNPHVTVLYGVKAVDEEKTKKILSKIPGKLVATLGTISLFENCEDPEVGKFDVLKIDVTSPQLEGINKLLRNKVEYENEHPKYHPHVTLAYLKPGTGKEYVGDKRFNGMKCLFEVFQYSNGNRDQLTMIPMLEYLVGQGGGYGGAAGGPVAPMNWAGTFTGPAQKTRLTKYQDNRRSSYMKGNTVVNNSLYDTIRPEDLVHPKFSPDEIEAGLKWEMKHMEYPDKTKAKPTVLQNLSKNPHYYSDLGMYHMDGKY